MSSRKDSVGASAHRGPLVSKLKEGLQGKDQGYGRYRAVIVGCCCCCPKGRNSS